MSKVVVAIPKKYSDFIDEEVGLVKAIYNHSNIDVIVIKGGNPKTYLSSDIVKKLKEEEVKELVVMDLLKPRQYFNLLKELRANVLDRMQVILEIFVQHAGSKEAQIQIELAKLRYELSIIKEAVRRAKMGELHGYLGGGEYGYEKYYTMAVRRVARLRREIEHLRNLREIRRKNREKLGYPHVAIVGYTCAGKTTLFNYITKNYRPVGPEPFTTLTPKASSACYNGVKLVFIDTVGFIRDLPPQLVEAFYATLEEIVYSDVIIVTVDASKRLSEIKASITSTNNILESIGAHRKQAVIALNKIDLVTTSRVEEIVEFLGSKLKIDLDNVVPISAAKGVNIEKLMEKVIESLPK
ncbi:MAG: GTPase HflX [Desulfurococcaceae archaeon]